MTRSCHGTWPAEPHCRAWDTAGWPWHGCNLEPGHPGLCKCRCRSTKRIPRRGRADT